MNRIIVNKFGGGYSSVQKGGQALGIACSPMTESKRGGQRHRGVILELIDSAGGDSYGK